SDRWLQRPSLVFSLPFLTFLNSFTAIDDFSNGWTPEADKAFVELNQFLQTNVVLSLPDYSKDFFRSVDVAEGHMKAVLPQKHGSQHRPTAYYSIQLQPVCPAVYRRVLPLQRLLCRALTLSCNITSHYKYRTLLR
uniref:Reverse transcriptase/retrotransposon-derived protein RNase H-like domain-containing protein n=1 Tax=Nothobranchius furzeri TaxID=105023 RepID=A0A8C6M2U1_NOTFU